MKIRKFFVFVLLVFACINFAACDVFFTQSPKSIEAKGTITFESSAFSDVSIKTKTQTICKTDANGTFDFTISANEIEIFAEKEGYVFSPRSIVLTENTDNISFVAEKVQRLDGEIVLASIVITPTSIASLPDNFRYSNDGNDCMKIKEFKVSISNFDYQNFASDKSLAIKNADNTYSTNEEYSIKTSSKFSILFSLSAYFQSYGNEYAFQETRLTTLSVPSNKTTANLNDNNQFVVSLVGINSSNNMFSYDVTFLFDYYKNI